MFYCGLNDSDFSDDTDKLLCVCGCVCAHTDAAELSPRCLRVTSMSRPGGTYELVPLMGHYLPPACQFLRGNGKRHLGDFKASMA